MISSVLRKGRIIALIILTLFLFSGCRTQNNSTRIDLTSGWEYALSENDVKNANFSALDSSKLANLEELVPEKKGYIWLKKTFSIPSSLEGKPLGIYLGRIALADKTFVNGVFVGGEGDFPPQEFSAWNTTRFYNLPSELLKDNNVILVQIWVDGEGSIVSNPFIGEIEDAKTSNSIEAFWNAKINLIFAFLMIIIGFYHLLMFLQNRSDRENLMFALINLLSAFYCSVFFYSELPGFSGENISFIWFQKIFSNALPFLFPLLITSFVLAFVHEKESRKIFYIRFAFALVPIAIVMFAKDYLVLRSMRWTQLLLIPPMFYVLYIIIRAIISKNHDAFALLLGFSPLVATVIADLIIHNILKHYYFPYITSIGWQLVIITLLFIMANRFVTSRRQAEDLNKNLERKVAERTSELSKSNEKLSAANEQLELTNTQLQEAKEKADKDMKLAVYVQNAFYKSNLPAFKDWDIAYTFRPAAGVSGDLYEFFHDGSKLNGVGLFDVSGHGIASGLVTMLAKNVIDKKFHEGLSLPFSKVMESISNQIAAEKGDVENYLTGVMFRMNEDKVEFINAGHPKVFLRVEKTGNIFPVEIKDSEAGGIIGFSGLHPKFAAGKFTVHPGDSIIMYTDCLNESKNKDGEQYTEERIAEIFKETGSTDANSRMQTVLNDFAAFTAGVPQADDLTVIVLQYKGK